VDLVGRVPPVRLAATLNGKPVSPEEFGRWELQGSEAAGFEFERKGTEWLLRPSNTSCCLLFWKRPSAGETSVSFVRLNTGSTSDVVTLPKPVLFDLSLPGNRLRLIWWYACPVACLAAIFLTLWYLVRLARKSRFSAKARFWRHDPSSGITDAIKLRKRAGFLKRWFWPSATEKARVDGMLVRSLGNTGSSVIIDGKSLDPRYELDSWSFNEQRKDKGLAQMDARLPDGGEISVMGTGRHGQAAVDRRYKYSKSGSDPAW
jgi:hypothetical protein